QRRPARAALELVARAAGAVVVAGVHGLVHRDRRADLVHLGGIVVGRRVDAGQRGAARVGRGAAHGGGVGQVPVDGALEVEGRRVAGGERVDRARRQGQVVLVDAQVAVDHGDGVQGDVAVVGDDEAPRDGGAVAVADDVAGGV